MIYLDNAATTWPKPPAVQRAVCGGLTRLGANPGRGAYTMADQTGEAVYQCRKKTAAFFGLDTPEKAVFTPGCTHSINYVLKGGLRRGGHVIISDLEHNAVVRPLHSLSLGGASVTRARVTEGDPDATLRAFRNALRRDTDMIFCTHASNVFGIRLPVEELGAMCRERGLMFGVDAAQSAGVLDTAVGRLGVDYLCAPAHKGLYGTMGLGLLLCPGTRLPVPMIDGGTGSMSSSRSMPELMPDRFESGTLNVPGVCALSSGLDFIGELGRERLAAHEYALMQQLYEGLKRIDGVNLYTTKPSPQYHTPLLSFNIGDLPSVESGERLARRDIAVRAGYHCAYDAHLARGTSQRGTVRACPSAFTSEADIDALIRAVHDISFGK